MSCPNDNQLFEYMAQLTAVREALKDANDTQKADLLDLKLKLEELVLLLQGGHSKGLNTEKPEENDHPEKSVPVDDEFKKFQMEIMELEGSSTIRSSPDDDNSSSESEDEDGANQELLGIVTSLEGNKCRAPFNQPWGEKGYHNAIIFSSEFDPEMTTNIESIQVKVMFCNPICDSMKPCAYFLDGHCKFSEDKCRYSHGYTVSFSDLQEFLLPNYSQLKRDSKCLARYQDSLWYRATIEKCLEEQKYLIKYDRFDNSEILEAHCIFPLESEENHNSEDSDLRLASEDVPIEDIILDKERDEMKEILPLCTTSFGEWEQHTKGMGSKLMAKMGYVWGQGLGKNADGRIEPVEAVVLPAGKSLDKCVELRERGCPKGPISVEIKMGLEKEKEEKRRAKSAKSHAHRRKKVSVFDFINNKISGIKDQGQTLKVRREPLSLNQDKHSSSKNLNMQIFSVGEDIKKTQKELSRLQQSLIRNSERNIVIRSQVEKKIAVQNDVLKSLQAKELKINQEMKSHNNHKSLSLF